MVRPGGNGEIGLGLLLDDAPPRNCPPAYASPERTSSALGSGSRPMKRRSCDGLLLAGNRRSLIDKPGAMSRKAVRASFRIGDNTPGDGGGV